MFSKSNEKHEWNMVGLLLLLFLLFPLLLVIGKMSM